MNTLGWSVRHLEFLIYLDSLENIDNRTLTKWIEYSPLSAKVERLDDDFTCGRVKLQPCIRSSRVEKATYN